MESPASSKPGQHADNIIEQLNYAEFRAHELARMGRKLSLSRSWKITGGLRTTRATLQHLLRLSKSVWKREERPRTAMLSQACKIISKSGLFDEHFYVTQLKLNQITSTDPLVHFIMEGWQMGLCPNFLFDCRFYTSQIENLGGQVTVNPLLHYIIEGHKTEARTSPFFDPSWYIKQYDDVLHSGTTPLAHFLQFGLLEGRSPAAHIPHLLPTDWKRRAYLHC